MKGIYWHSTGKGEDWGDGRWLSFDIDGTVMRRLWMRVYDKSKKVLVRMSEDTELLHRQAAQEEYISGLRGIGMHQQPDGEWREEHPCEGRKVFSCYSGKFKATVSEQEDPDVPEMAWQLRITEYGDFGGVDYFTTEEEAKAAFEIYLIERELSR